MLEAEASAEDTSNVADVKSGEPGASLQNIIIIIIINIIIITISITISILIIIIIIVI